MSSSNRSIKTQHVHSSTPTQPHHHQPPQDKRSSNSTTTTNMAAQSLASRRATSSPSSSTSSAASDRATTKVKRARTKHACDECRRSQKKCDGDRPRCHRCYLNGTQCTYTPHKSRSHCACTGQQNGTGGTEEVHRDRPEADVYIFPIDPRSSFHTWSAHSSPDHSPTNSGLDTPSPTLYTQEELDATYNNSYTNPGHTARANVHVNTTNTTNHRHHQFQAGLPRNHHNHIYSQRSLSLPNVSAQSSSASRTAVTPQSLSASLPQQQSYPLLPTQTQTPHGSLDQVYGNTTANQHFSSSPPPSTYDAVNMHQNQHHQYASQNSSALFDLSTTASFQQTLSDAEFSQHLSAAIYGTPSSDSPPPMHIYAQGTQAGQPTQQQLTTSLDSFDTTATSSLRTASGYASTPSIVFPTTLLEPTANSGVQVQQREQYGSYGCEQHQRSGTGSGVYPSTPIEASPLSVGWGSPNGPPHQHSASPSPSPYSSYEYYDWAPQH